VGQVGVLSMALWDQYKDVPFEAPRFTHSCYRYFRPCSFVPICDIAEDDPPMTLMR
jgi:hypothetical protein